MVCEKKEMVTIWLCIEPTTNETFSICFSILFFSAKTTKIISAEKVFSKYGLRLAACMAWNPQFSTDISTT